MDGSGNVYIVVSGQVRKVDAAGVITTVAGTGGRGYSGDGGPATDAQLGGPRDVAVDGSGNLYIAEYTSSRVRKVDAGGSDHDGSGHGRAGLLRGRRPGTNAQIYSPVSVAVDGLGNLYIADAGTAGCEESTRRE